MQYCLFHFVFVPVDGKCFVNILYIYSNKFYDVSKGKRSQSYKQRSVLSDDLYKGKVLKLAVKRVETSYLSRKPVHVLCKTV